VFTDRDSAAEHFGKTQIETPACVLSKDEKGLVGLLREALEELRDFRNEDDRSSRFFYEIGARHSREQREEEEKGYARGLRDGQKIPTVTLTLSKPYPYYEIFQCDDPSAPGSPPVGRGDSLIEALGSWVHRNRDRLRLVINIDESAAKAEQERRQEELGTR
jgi:hypothetical protein